MDVQDQQQEGERGREEEGGGGREEEIARAQMWCEKGKNRAPQYYEEEEEEPVDEVDEEDNISPVRDDGSTLKGIACPERKNVEDTQYLLGVAVSEALLLQDADSIVSQYCFAAREGIREFIVSPLAESVPLRRSSHLSSPSRRP